MSIARLIRRLLKRLSQVLIEVLIRVTTSSVQKLRILLFCFRRFVTKFRSLSSHSIESLKSAPESYTILASPSSEWCSPAALPLPLHNVPIIPGTATNSTQGAPSPSPQLSTTAILVQPTPQQANPPQMHAEVVISNNSRFTVNFAPGSASNNPRYENRHYADRREYKGLPALMREFPNGSCPWLNDTYGWKSCVHPEGAIYLYNENLRTFTEGNMDEVAFHLVHGSVEALRKLCPASVKLEDNNIDLVLQIAEVDGNDASCQYYFVDHARRTLFWLEEHTKATDDIFCGLRGIYDPSHIAFALETEYWAHCEHYPNHKLDHDKLLKELRGLVVYARAEIITSNTSLSPFGAEELSSILELIDHLEALSEHAEADNIIRSTCVMARFMYYFSRAKFFNFCGLPCARLDADQSVYEEVTGSLHLLTSILSSVLDAMLFWSPQAHFNELRRVWVDECIIAPRWKDFSRNLMAEWNGITIYSTVMLAVDVSFLAVLSVGSSYSFGIITTDLSIIFITGSLIASLLLARQTQRYGPESAEGAAQLLLKMTGTPFGTKALGMVHSLPYAMLMWGMIFFVISFLYNVLKSRTRELLASVVSGIAIVTVLILWFIWAAREVHIFRALAKRAKDFITGDS